MVVEIRIRFRHRGCYSEGLPPGVQVTHLSGDGERCLCTVRGPPGADLAGVVAAMRAWQDAEPAILDRSAQSWVVRCSCPRRGLTPTLAEWGATVLWPVVHEGGIEHWHLVVATREVAADVLARLAELGEVHVERIGSPSADELGASLPLGELTQALSARQLAALRLAIERGYYENPRRATLAELAASAGLARSTFQEHLQKAEQQVMDRFGSVLTRHPVVAAAARRRAGRPPRR